MSPGLLYYEEQLREYIMNAFLGEKNITLNQLIEEFFDENQQDYQIIQNAYLNVKNELVGKKDSLV